MFLLENPIQNVQKLLKINITDSECGLLGYPKVLIKPSPYAHRGLTCIYRRSTDQWERALNALENI